MRGSGQETTSYSTATMYIKTAVEGEHMCDCKRDWLWIGSPLEELKYLIFSFLRIGVETKRGVEFRHSTRNAFRNQRKVGSGLS